MNSTSSPRTEFVFRWLLAAATFVSVLFFFSPSWAAFRYGTRIPEMGYLIEVRRGLAVINQMEHPGAIIADQLHSAIQWRLLFPMIGRIFKLPPPWLFGLSHLGCLLLLGYAITLLREQKLSWTNCSLASVLLGSASWFFTSTGWLGYYDSWLALGLMLVAYSKNRWIVWITCLLTPWVDERFIMAVPLAFLCRWALTQMPSPTEKIFTWVRRELIVAALLLGAFVVVRLGVLPQYSAKEATIRGYMAVQNYLQAPMYRIALGIFEGLRLGWVFVLTALFLLRRKPGFAYALTGLVITIVFLGLYTAQDYSRSMTMLLPSVMLGLLLATREQAAWLPLALRISTGFAVVLPAYHVMNDGIQPINSLYHELSFLKSPPPYAIPEVHEIQGIDAVARGQYAEAEFEFTLATKLAQNPASALLQRGQLYANGKRWSDAFNDFTNAIEHDSDNPEAWFMRAQTNFAMGFTDDAGKDMSKALAVGSKDWSLRPDVARFRANLNKVIKAP